MTDNNHFNEEEFLKKVENAAKKGASKRSILGTLLSLLPLLVIIGLLIMTASKVGAFGTSLADLTRFDNHAEDNDLVLDNQGLFGYTAANFEEAILGDSQKLKKLEIFEQEVSDVSTITETGLLNWGVFTKNQIITYNGTAVYTVDLSSLTEDDILFNEEEKIITLRIPHSVQEEINIPEDKIQFGDTDKGLLAFGDIKMTAEQASEIQAETREKMIEKLNEMNVLETADRFAKLTVWEMYSPIIKGVAKDYSLEVEFR